MGVDGVDQRLRVELLAMLLLHIIDKVGIHHVGAVRGCARGIAHRLALKAERDGCDIDLQLSRKFAVGSHQLPGYGMHLAAPLLNAYPEMVVGLEMLRVLLDGSAPFPNRRGSFYCSAYR